MKYPKSIALLLFSALLTAFTLSACGNADENDDKNTDSTEHQMHDDHEMEDGTQMEGPADMGGETMEGAKTVRYQCPMKCEGDKTYKSNVGCPVCGMDLEKVKS